MSEPQPNQTTRAPSGWAPVALVTRREIRERLRAKAFRWSTALLLVATVIGVALPKLLGSDDATTLVRVGATGSVPADVRELLAEIDPEPASGGSSASGQTVVITYAFERSGRQAVRNGSVSFLVAPGRMFAGHGVGGDQAGASARVFATARELLRLRSGLADVGVPPAGIGRALSAKPPTVIRLAARADSIHRDQIPLVTAATLFMYLILILYGQAVAGGVNEEKSSRVVELLLSSMRPRQLLSGKVAGIGLVGLVQVALVAAAAGVTALVVGTKIPSGSPVTALAYVVWFALAYALYCTLFAAAGSLTSRAEESQQAATPVIILLVLGYAGAFTALGAPDSGVATVLSFVPFSAPLVMPVRAAVGSVPIVAIGAAMLLTVIATVLLNRVAGRIYAGALLRFGPRVKLREVLRSGGDGDDRPGPSSGPENRQPVTTDSPRAN